MGETRVHELLCILDFNNIRSRMSVVFRENGKIRLYCKGADSVIFDRLESGNEEYNASSLQHLNVSGVVRILLVNKRRGSDSKLV